jgi:hypothetical protein
MDKLVEWGMWHNKETQNNKCGKCGMEKTGNNNEGCCKDEYKHVKLQSDHKAAENSLLQLNSIAIAPAYFEIHNLYWLSATEEYIITHAPPRYNSVAIYIHNCIFLN